MSTSTPFEDAQEAARQRRRILLISGGLLLILLLGWLGTSAGGGNDGPPESVAVDDQGQQDDLPGAGNGSGGPGGAATDGPTGTTTPGTSSGGSGGGGSGGSGGGGSGGSGGGGSGGSGGGGSGGSGGGSVTGSGHGYTEDTINIGIHIVKDTEAAFEAVGAGVAPDEPGIAETMVEWINQTGGLAGRQVEPLYHESAITQGTWASHAQALCEDYTSDKEVVVVISSATGGTDAIWSCLSEAGIPLVERNVWLFDDPYYNEFPDTLYTPFAMSPNRSYSIWLDGLDELNFFDDAVVGLLRFDGQPFDRLTADVVKPRLDQLGVTECSPPVTTSRCLGEDITITSPPSIAGFGQMSTELNNAIIRMRTSNPPVTHVIMVENAGIMPFFLLQLADSQEWYPEYGFSSYDIPLTLNGLAPPDQLENGVGVSWTPPRDVARIKEGDDPGRDEREALCREIYGSVGFHEGSMCDAFLFLRAALDRATSLDKNGLAGAARSLGTGYQSAMGVRTEFWGNQYYDAGAAYRLFDWVEGCAEVEGEEFGCYQYVTGPRNARR